MTDPSIQADPSASRPEHDGAAAVGGMDLGSLVATHGPQPWPVVRWFAIQLAEELETLHASGSAHGSVTAPNIRLRHPWPSHEITLAASASGNDTAEDLRTLGRTLSEILSGEADTPEASRTFAAIASGEISDAGGLNDFLSSALLASLPPADERPVPHPSASTDFWDEKTLSPAPSAKPRKSPLPLIIGAAAAVIVAGGLALLLIPKEKPALSIEDPAAKEREAAELAERQRESERIAAEKAAAEQAERDRLAMEKAAAEKAALEKEAAARAEAEKLAAEKAEKERLAMEKAAAEKAEKERLAMEKAAAEKAAAEKAAREADSLAARDAAILEDNDTPASAKEKAFSDMLALAREREHPKAIELCGLGYWFGIGVAKDQEEASKWFAKGAALGIPRSMLGYGNCFAQGIGVDKDRKQAASWWTKAAEAGEPLAMSRLGEHYNSDPADKDVGKAMKWWQKAADLGVPEAMTNLGILHAAGSAGKADPAAAIALWEKAASLGEPRAKTELGYKYFNGEVKGKGKDEAFRLFQEAVKEKDPRAMTGLGVCYLTGGGTKADKDEAVKWLRQAAELGEPTAGNFLKQINAQ